MLILTRRVGETVMIGNDVTVTVLGVKGNQVRVGINAPKNVAVHREEIYKRIKREQAKGANGGDDGNGADADTSSQGDAAVVAKSALAQAPQASTQHELIEAD